MLAERVKEWTLEWRRQGLEEGRKAGRQEGHQEGLEEGELILLRRQLTHRFGPLPDWVQTKLAEASRENIENWGERLLDTASLDEVFAGV